MLLTSPNIPTQSSTTSFFSKYAALLHIALRAGDAVIVLVSALLCHWLRFHSIELDAPYNAVTLRAALLVLLVFPAFGLYRSWRGESIAAEVGRACAAWLAVLALLLVTEWMLKNTAVYSRLWAGTWCGLTLALLATHRWVARHILGLLHIVGVDVRRIMLVGATPAGSRIIEATRSHNWMGLNVVGYVQTSYDQAPIEGLPSLGGMDELLAAIEHYQPDQVWVALPMRAEALIQHILDVTSDKPVTVRFVPDLFGYEMINHQALSVAGVPVITLRGSRIEGHSRVLKAIMDRLLAAVMLLLLSPLMLLLALGVKLSSAGPVFYRQKRHGLGGQEIEVWKFRSMRVHFESDGRVTQASRHDLRVTRFGRFLRASSLDELPQLINVLRGTMSIVGPRPHALAHNYHYTEKLRGYMLRHGVKPGLTGLAQIRGFRGETDTLDKMAGRVDSDIDYISNWSLWLDIKIIAMTPIVLMKRTNAY